MRQFTIGVDLDNVIVQTDPAIRAIIARISGVSLSQDDSADFAYSTALMARGLQRAEARAIEQEALKIFHEVEAQMLELVPGALDGLRTLERAGLSPVVITSRPASAEPLTRAGLLAAELSFPELLFAADKAAHAAGWLCLIDDAPHHVEAVIALGVPVCVLDYPWNRGLPPDPRIHRCSDWPEIVANILRIARRATALPGSSPDGF